MSAVSPVLLRTIKELQSLPSLEQFALAGGTNLTYRFEHRESQDIDLFCPNIVGIEHFETIEKEVIDYYGKDKISGIDYPIDKDSEQYTYLRFYIITESDRIKIEIIQNMKMMDSFNVIEGVRLVSLRDIGLFKLISSSWRGAKKDIYDINFITEEIALETLYKDLKEKKRKFSEETDKNIFDLENETCPIENYKLLLNFETLQTEKKNSIKPNHSNDRIIIVGDNIGWQTARLDWRKKVRSLGYHLKQSI